MYTESKIKRINVKNYGGVLKLSMDVVISKCYLAEDSMDLLPQAIKFVVLFLSMQRLPNVKFLVTLNNNKKPILSCLATCHIHP